MSLCTNRRHLVANIQAKLFRLKDRKDVPIMLSPTHEEEITSLVASTLKSYKDLPLKLYQISMSLVSLLSYIATPN